jgi:hypothetical protein
VTGIRGVRGVRGGEGSLEQGKGRAALASAGPALKSASTAGCARATTAAAASQRPSRSGQTAPADDDERPPRPPPPPFLLLLLPFSQTTMGKAKKTRKFAAVKRMLNPADPRLSVPPAVPGLTPLPTPGRADLLALPSFRRRAGRPTPRRSSRRSRRRKRPRSASCESLSESSIQRSDEPAARGRTSFSWTRLLSGPERVRPRTRALGDRAQSQDRTARGIVQRSGSTVLPTSPFPSLPTATPDCEAPTGFAHPHPVADFLLPLATVSDSQPDGTGQPLPFAQPFARPALPRPGRHQLHQPLASEQARARPGHDGLPLC